MASPKNNVLLPLVLLALCLLASGVTARPAAAGDAVCYTSSKHFSGLCFSSSNCANVCHGEGHGYTGGSCSWFSCKCSRPCPLKN